MEKIKQHKNEQRTKRRRKLISQGLCSNDCGRPLIVKWFCRECADKVNQYARNHYWKNHEHNVMQKRKHMHKYRFGGLRDKVLERDNFACKICGYSKKNVVHHINENPKDNRMENLITLCLICHNVVERINKSKPNLHFIFPWFK